MIDPNGGNLFIVGSSGHKIFVYTGNEDDLVMTVRENRYSIRAIIILSCVDHIPECSFESCNRLEVVQFQNPSSVRRIGNFAFADCSRLKSIDLSSVRSIGWKAFSKCSSLRHLTFGMHLQSIGGYAFYRCISLRSVVIPSVEVIKCYAFRECYNLDTIELPDVVREIGERAFVHCIRLTHLTMPMVIEYPREVLHRCSFLYCDNISQVDFRLFGALAPYLGLEFSDDLSRIIDTFQQSTQRNSTDQCKLAAMIQLCTSMYNVYLERVSDHLCSMRSAKLSVSYTILSTLCYGNVDEDTARLQLDLDYGIVNVVVDRVLSFLQVPDSLSIVAHGVEVKYRGIHKALDQISYNVAVSSPSDNESDLDFSSDDSIFSRYSSSSSDSTY